MIPGVPIVYVKRSVMILEELSGASEAVRRKAEKDKFSEGLIGLDRKRKRGEGDADSEDEDLGLEDGQTGPKVRGAKRAKGPNPLSVRKKKVKTTQVDGQPGGKEEGQTKRKRKRRGKNAGGNGQAEAGVAVNETA
jgi:U3 small nucleolar RNA-associated protein 23